MILSLLFFSLSTFAQSVRLGSVGATSVVADVQVLSQTSNVGAATLYTPIVDETLRASVYCQVQVAASVSSTMPTGQITFTKADNNTSSGTKNVSATSTANTTATINTGTYFFRAKGGTAVQYSTGSYASSGTPSMSYSCGWMLERMGT